MKMKVRHIALLISVLLCTAGGAQTRTAVPCPSIDTDIKAIRDNINPNLRYTVDDYLQYSPAVVMLGMKACGYKSRSGWGRMLVADAFSVGIMAGVVNGLKYTVKRPRPDLSANNSFPSGHTATSFMTASLLHKEYGWRSPWFSFGAYAMASFCGVSRILNNKHYMSDVIAGAAIGIGSVELGYFLSDLIFKEKHLYDGYVKPEMFPVYDPEHKYYEVGLYFARRFVLGTKAEKEAGTIPTRGGVSGIYANIPMIPRTGLAVRLGANSLSYNKMPNHEASVTSHPESDPSHPELGSGSASVNMYNALAGVFWTYPLPKWFEFDAKAMIGYAWHPMGNGIDMLAETAASFRAGDNFRIKAFAEYELFSYSEAKPFLSSFLLGFSTAFVW